MTYAISSIQWPTLYIRSIAYTIMEHSEQLVCFLFYRLQVLAKLLGSKFLHREIRYVIIVKQIGCVAIWVKNRSWDKMKVYP